MDELNGRRRPIQLLRQGMSQGSNTRSLRCRTCSIQSGKSVMSSGTIMGFAVVPSGTDMGSELFIIKQ